MATDVEYQDLLDDAEAELDAVPEDPPRSRVASGRDRDRDCRRAIEDLHERKRLRSLLSDFELDDEAFDDRDL